jgi:hypothetical protein
VVSRFHRHGLGIQRIVVVLQFTSQDLDVARGGKSPDTRCTITSIAGPIKIRSPTLRLRINMVPSVFVFLKTLRVFASNANMVERKADARNRRQLRVG